MQRTVTSAVALFMLVPFASLASANSQNDAGTGGDAPNDSGGALDLALGSYTGAVNYSGGDLEDWYAFTVPTGSTLEVDFHATTGGLYGGIYDDNGTLVQNSYSAGGSVALTTETSGRFRVGFGDQNGVGNASYAFTAAQNASLAPQNDAGSGGDAPAYGGGLPLSTGNFSGALVPADRDMADAYTAIATTPSGQHLCMVGHYSVHIEGDGVQVRLDPYGVSPVLDTPVTFRADSCVRWAVEVTDAAANSSEPLAYSMVVTTPATDDLPDFAVSELRVSDVPFNGPFGPSDDSPFEKAITFQVSNAGSAATGSARLDIHGSGTPGYSVTFGNLALAKGESRNYTYRWNTAGVVGTVNIAATAILNGYDRDYSNNTASTNATLVAALPGGLAVIPPPLVFVPNSSPNGTGQAGPVDTVCSNAVVAVVDHPPGGSGPWPRACGDWNGKLWLPLINVDLCDRYGNSTVYNTVAQQTYDKPPCSPTLNQTAGSLLYAP